MRDVKRLTGAVVRVPGKSFVEGLTTVELGPADYNKAVEQHAAYCAALERCGLTLTRLETDERYPDSTFVEDTAVIVGAVANVRPESRYALLASRVQASPPYAILTRPGASSRAGEVITIRKVLSGFCQELHAIQKPGTVDGGDICEAGNHFFIGVSARTNGPGALQLALLVASYGYTSSFIDIRAVKNILHLKSGLAWLGHNRLAVIEALAEREEFRGYELVRVNAGEQYATNCVLVNDYVLVATGYPEFKGTLQELGYKTLSVEMTEFQKLDGGLSCLSLRF